MPRLRVDDLDVHYLARGPAPARGQEPLILVHGAGGSGEHWRWVLEHLPRTAPACAPDLPGHGSSGGQVPNSVEAAASVLEAFLARRYPGVPVTLVGHSMGGTVALALALARPERVARLCLIASAARIQPHPRLLKQLLGGAVDEEFVRAGFSGGVPEDRLRLVVDDFRRVRTSAGATDFMGAQACDLSSRLAWLRLPLLILAARSDLVVSPRKSRAVAEQVPGARLLVLEGGHYLHVERPEEVAAAIAAM